MFLVIIGKVLLTILKILLFLFLFVLFLLCLVLFVPVRYKAAGRYFENKTELEGRVSWLLHSISLKVESDGSEVSYILRVFGKKILPGKGRKRKEKNVKDHKRDAHKKKVVSKKNKNNNKRNISEKKQDSLHDDLKEKNDSVKKENDSADIENNKNVKYALENERIEEKTDDKKNIFGKIFSIIKKIPDFFKKLIKGIKNFIDTVKKMWSAIKNGSEKAGLVKEFALCTESRNMVCLVRDNVLHLLKHIKPRYVFTDITFGFDDPSMTGKVLGALAAFCAMAGFKPGLTPDFEKKIFEGEIKIKGRITIFVLLKIAAKVGFSEEIKSFRKEYDNFREVL